MSNITHSDFVQAKSHSHAFLGSQHDRNSRRMRIVIAISAIAMVAEIVGGQVFGSIALLADGWHMLTHLSAFGIALFAYRMARRLEHDPRFTFGAGKFGDLAAFASALGLAGAAFFIGYESLLRFASPVVMQPGEALLVAGVGLIVNLASAWLLAGNPPGVQGHIGEIPDAQEAAGHGHAHAHDHGGHTHTDHNARAAYMHVLADALTSILAILGIVGVWQFGWTWLDPAIGLLGAAVILRWSVGLMRRSGAILLDAVPEQGIADAIRAAIESGGREAGDNLADLHVWRLGPGHVAAILSIVSDRPAPPEAYKAKLKHIPHLTHVTVEVHPCGHAQPAEV